MNRVTWTRLHYRREGPGSHFLRGLCCIGSNGHSVAPISELPQRQHGAALDPASRDATKRKSRPENQGATLAWIAMDCCRLLYVTGHLSSKTGRILWLCP